jgi:Ser/Thr protein kinase RdoA (MazF antagonist)
MNIFPAQYSTLSSLALKDFIVEKYGFQNVDCRLLVRNVSDTYILEGDGLKYILKIYRTTYRSLDEIKGEVELLNILKKEGVPVAYPIADLSGNQIQQFQAAEGIRYGVLFSFAQDKVIPIPNDEQLRIIGRNVAFMHNITSTCKLQHQRIVYDINSTLKQPLEIIKQRFTDMPQEYAFLKDLADKVITESDHFDTSVFSYGYCHYDLLPKNFHFDDHDNITFFDFDWMGEGFLVNDLMTFFVQLFFLVTLNAINREEADRMFSVFIEGYREKRTITENELKLTPYLGVMFWMYAFRFYEENYDDFSNTFLTPRFIKERVKLIKTWVEWYCKFS